MKKVVSFLLAIAVQIGVLTFAGTTAQAATVKSSAGRVVTSGGRLNVRADKSTGAAVVASLQKDSKVTLLSKSGSWWYVEYDKGKYGYSHADYIVELGGKPATVATKSGNLNVRNGAGTSYSVMGRLAKGEGVVVLSQTGGWSQILYHGVRTGYVSSQYLQTASTISAISLGVPNFKQTDSRWANVKIGNSGKTIAQIGCTTTAIAMMESYRQGRTIYPDAMSKQLSYTSSGSLYWPSDYQVVQHSAGYLSGVYEQLKAGKPVLFGAKTSAGRQHWVVIAGFTGGAAFTADRFIVNDPGSNSRTTLQHLLNEYPVFYKYFYYK